MDSLVNAGDPVPAPDSQMSDDGSGYLRRLRQNATGEAPTPPACSAPPAMATEHLPTGEERRRSPRFRCSGSAEFRVEGSDVRMWGTLSDVSLHGCYVEMNNTFPVDTRVSLLLEVMGIRAQMQAVVRVSYPFLGMGLCFLKIEPGQLMQLERLLAALARPVAVSNPDLMPTSSVTTTHSLADVDPKVMLDGLTEFFRTNPLLSRDEFYQIANRARR